MLTLAAFFVALGFGVMIPVLPIFGRSFGVSNFLVGVVISAFAGMRLLTSPFCPRINLALGERNAITAGMLIVAASSVAAGMAHSYAELLIWRALGGIGSAMFTVAAMALLLASAPPESRGRAAGLYQGGFLLGGMAGPAIGGALAGISLTAPFFFYAGTLGAAAATSHFLLPKGQRALAHEASAGRSFSAVASDVRYQAACVSAFAQGWTSFGVRASLVPVLIVEGLHQAPSVSGTVFAIAAVAQTAVLLPVGTAVDRLGRKPVMIAAGLITGLSAAAAPFAPSVWILTAVLCLYGIGSAAQGTAPTAAVGDVVGGRGGSGIAVFSMMTDVGAITGPLVAGWLADKAGMPAAFAVGAAFLLAGSIYSFFIPKEAHAQAAERTRES